MIRRIATLAVLVLALTSLMAPTVVGIETHAYATNESSYRYGVHLAINNLTNQIVPPWDVDEDNPPTSWYVKWPSHFFMNPDICNLDSMDNGCPSTGDVQAGYCTTGQSDYPQVTNSTACIDGYVHGWKTWCTEDNYKNAKYCSDLVFGGNTKDDSDFDGTLYDEVMSNQSAHFKSIKNYVDSWRYFCTKDGYENARECTESVFIKHNFPGIFMNQNKTLLSIMPLQSLLSGSTWNFVNESNGHGLHPYPQNTSTIINNSVKKIQNEMRSIGSIPTNGIWQIGVLSNITKFSGKITFYWYQVHIKTDNGIDVDYAGNPSWNIGVGDGDGNGNGNGNGGNHETLVLHGITPIVKLKDGSAWFPPVVLTFLKINPHLVELKDHHGDIILLIRNNGG